MNISPETASLVFNLINALVTLAIGIFVWFSKRSDETETQLNELTTRMTAVEADLKHMPTSAEISRVRETLATVCADNHAQTESLKRVEASQRLITEWMLKNK